MNAQQRNEILSIIDPKVVLEIVGECFNPEDVFSSEQLTSWAEENGFTKEKEEQ